MSDPESEEAVADGLRLGDGLVDTATSHHNEAGVGLGVARTGVPARRSC